MQAASPPPSSSSKRPRVLQACTACRDAKLRCDLGDPTVPKDPPCRRCSRTGRHCEFVGSHLHCKPRKMRNRKNRAAAAAATACEQHHQQTLRPTQRNAPSASLGTAGPSGTPESVISATSAASMTEVGQFPAGGPRVYKPKFDRSGGGPNLETPADALRILCEAANDEPAAAPPPCENMGPLDSKMWSRWEPVRDGLLTVDEAGTLLAVYAHHLGPMHPVVPTCLFQPEHFPVLLNEPILLASISVTAAYFHDLGPSFDVAEPSRSKVIQTKLVAWLIARLGYLTMGDPVFRTIGTIEALLVLSEWPPRALLVKDPAGARSSSISRVPSACKMFDDLAWTLTGLALRLAQELSVHDEATYTDTNMPQWKLRRRVDCWINCLAADRHVSVRLGRVSLVQAKMSTNWWEALSDLIYVPVSENLLREVSDIQWRETQAISELTHHIGLLQDVLYATPQLTADLVRTRRFENILHRMKPELDSLSQWITSWNIEGDVLDEMIPGMEQEEIREIRIRIEIDYVRLYANAISMRAAHARLASRLKTSNGGHGLFDLSVVRWAEAPFLLEVVEAAVSLIRCGLAFHKRNVLRYCPGRTYLRMMFASVFLMKASSFGAVVQPDHEVAELQSRLISAFREAAIDEDHLPHQLASLLSRLLPWQQAATAARAEDVPENSQGGPGTGVSGAAVTEPLGFFNFDLASGAMDMSALGEEMGIDPANLQDALGFNPNGLVSFIEAMVATGGPGAFGGELSEAL